MKIWSPFVYIKKMYLILKRKKGTYLKNRIQAIHFTKPAITSGLKGDKK